MYHFVRDLAHSRFPRLTALNRDDFVEQLCFLKRYYTFISMEDLVDAAVNKEPLPPHAALLTFDDGYLDHFLTVFPLLVKFGIKGSFFPSAKAVCDNEVLLVNKIQLVLASCTDVGPIVQHIFNVMDSYRQAANLPPNDVVYDSLCTQSRYDTKDVTFIKRVLQYGLPRDLGSKIADHLFSEYVTKDDAAFARELYVDKEQLQCMIAHGMYVGSHGYDHRWLNTLSSEDQRVEITKSLEFLGELGAPTSKWVMCYPYGGYDDRLVELLRTLGCALGLTVDVGVADTLKHDPLLLPRLDTNDFPKDRNAPPDRWTKMVTSGSA